MSDLVNRQAERLACCTMLPASWDKRFARDVAATVAAGKPLTDKQAANVARLAWKYRRQMPDSLVPLEKPE